MPTPTDLVTDLPADFEVFGQAVDSSMADLVGGTTGQILAKNSNTNMDFVWVTNDVGDITAVTAGTGISGGGTSGAVTITNSMATEITASGDIIVGTGSGTFDNLPIGTTGQILTADTTVSPYKVKWATPTSTAFVGCSLETASTNINNNTDTYLGFSAELYDTDSMHSTVTNTSRITIPSGKDGYYEFRWSLMWGNSAAGNRRARLVKNGSGYELGPVLTVAGVGLTGFSNSSVVSTVGGDYWELQVFQDSGGTLATGGAGTLFQATKVG
jgi:hypothetical protein